MPPIAEPVSPIPLIVTVYVVGLSLYHLLSGALSYFVPDVAMRFYRRLYDCNPIEQRHLRIILRPWGALAIFAGVAGLGTLPNPTRAPWLLGGLALLLGLRIGYRIHLQQELRAISGIAPRRNWISIAVLTAGVAVLAAGIHAGIGAR
jgi:hypothetical protein